MQMEACGGVKIEQDWGWGRYKEVPKLRFDRIEQGQGISKEAGARVDVPQGGINGVR